ncbi:sialidase family protein [Catalinimonas sp. 4WD22]|uniref:sialidase family protein n=1 Tax=Catalinimonas locisalis TaxID=3133978 RepID=UPI003101426E
MLQLNLPLYLLLLSLHTSVALAQITPIKIHEGIRDLGPCEPSIAINPNNTDQIVAGSVLDNVYYSEDGGLTWQIQSLNSPYGVWGDPCIIADYDNNFHYFHLSNPGGKGWRTADLLDRIVAQKSTDGGKTWTGGTSIGYHDKRHDQDKEWATVNPQNNYLYVSWTEFDKYESTRPKDSTYILFSKSTDKGESWSEAIRINQKAGNCLDDDLTVEGAVPAVGPKGEIYIAWAFNDTIFFDRSEDDGQSWLAQDKVVASQPGGWTFEVPGLERCNGLPVTACDLSQGEHRGTVYVNWVDLRNGEEDADVWIAKSTDGGEHWSEPIRVNDDEAGHHQFFTWMTVDPVSGYVYVVFYDRRNTEGNDTDVYLACSKDGGETFTNIKLTENPFLLEEKAFFGDYTNIAAYDGIIYPIWTQIDGKKLSVWTVRIREDELK